MSQDSDLPFRDLSSQSFGTPQSSHGHGGRAGSKGHYGRRASEGLPTNEAQEMREAVRSVRRMKTMPILEESRHDDVHIGPQARAHLHKLHEAHKKKHRGFACVSEDMSSTALNGWGQGDSWHVHTKLPPGIREQAFNLRAFQVVPPRKNGEKAPQFLQRNGVAAVNTKGHKGSWDATLGQDACSISHLSQGWEVICLMDGHGTGGHWPAVQSARTLPYVLQNSPSCVRRY